MAQYYKESNLVLFCQLELLQGKPSCCQASSGLPASGPAPVVFCCNNTHFTEPHLRECYSALLSISELRRASPCYKFLLPTPRNLPAYLQLVINALEPSISGAVGGLW